MRKRQKMGKGIFHSSRNENLHISLKVTETIRSFGSNSGATASSCITVSSSSLRCGLAFARSLYALGVFSNRNISKWAMVEKFARSTQFQNVEDSELSTESEVTTSCCALFEFRNRLVEEKEFGETSAVTKRSVVKHSKSSKSNILDSALMALSPDW